MCLAIDKSKHRKKYLLFGNFVPLMAKENMKVFKVLYKYDDITFTSMVEHYEYKLPSEHSVEKMEFGNFDKGSVFRGFHAFTDYYKTLRDWNWIHGTKLRIVTMIIPYGSKYFIGMDGDIVSDRIMLPHQSVD